MTAGKAGGRPVPADLHEPFRTTVRGKHLVLPNFRSVPPGLVNHVRRMSDTDASFTMLEMLVPEESLPVVFGTVENRFRDGMSSDELDALMKEWMDHSGVSLGE